ncbi:phosphatase PAP2 family protein [Fictibacillus sp. UD]|uniref:phosphatase PAP2 family protein n=1 Tax=Fictibacillus sp. UD TaxID=3038777 RepID=UPI003745D13C
MISKKSVIRTVVLTAVCLGLFIMFAFIYKQSRVELFDVWAMKNISDIHQPVLIDVFTFFTNSASKPYQYAIFIFFAVIWLVGEKKWIEPFVLGVCLFGIRFENQWFKNWFERDRPMYDRVIEITGYSFPSGHAMISIAFFGLLSYLLVQNYAFLRAYRKYIYFLTALFIGLVGFSRVYLGVHFPTDVLGGYAAGGTWLLLCVLLYKWLVGLSNRRVH